MPSYTTSYTKETTLRVAKRYRNAKRAYLLVNPLQAKHMPVSPTEALAMMRTLGAGLRQEFPGARLVLGFAETATALGAAVASRLGPDCAFLTTTREAWLGPFFGGAQPRRRAEALGRGPRRPAAKNRHGLVRRR